MGRITVFSGNDVNSKLVLRELQRRKLPFTEISVESFPDRIADVQAMCEVPSVPQVFFNTRLVGGVDDIKKELRRWDRSSRYETPLEKYEGEIASGFDPTNKRLALPEGNPKTISHAALSVLSPTSIELPDGTMTSFRDITEKLKNTLPTVELRSNGILYHHVFTGAETVSVFMRSLNISQEQAISFGNTLMQAQVIQPLKRKTKKFLKDENAHYRLQCFNQPTVLNSYCLWKGQDPTTNPAKLVVDLIRLLDDIETSSIDGKGQIDYSKARQHNLYPLLEESVCELQKISPIDLPHSQMEKLSLALNIYLLMMRYAFFKVGIPLSESDRLQFLANVQFNMSGTLYSFDDWCDVVLGRPKKGKPGLGIQGVDIRTLFAMHTGAVSGSKLSLPFSAFSAVDDSVIEAQLTVAARVFVGDENNVSVNRKKGNVTLSNLFQSKRADLPCSTDCDLLEGILPYLGAKKKLDITALIKCKSFKTFKYVEPTLGQHTNNSLWFDKEALEVDEKGLRGMLKRFRPPKMHKNERARLATLRSLNILDTLEEERYDRIVSISSFIRDDSLLEAQPFSNLISIWSNAIRRAWSGPPLTCRLSLCPWWTKIVSGSKVLFGKQMLVPVSLVPVVTFRFVDMPFTMLKTRNSLFQMPWRMIVSPTILS